MVVAGKSFSRDRFTRRINLSKSTWSCFLGICCALLATGWNLSAQDLSVNGDLDVAGTVDIKGESIGLGTRSDTSTEPGISVGYVDGTVSSLEFRSGRETHEWKWLLKSGSAFSPQMVLGADNTLVIYDQASTPAVGITLNPAGVSTFEQSVLVNGADNRLPNQTLVDENSILTVILADGRYAKAGSLVVLGSGSASGSYSLSSGNGTTASGDYSLAGGNFSQAQGEASVAFGTSSIAVATSSFATGNEVRADGGFASVAMGNGALAEGYVSQAIGHYTWTRGWFTTALGSNTVAKGMAQLVAGQFNVEQGTVDQWIATDDLFILGNGTSDTARSNAFVVKKNGDTTITGKATVSGEITLSQGGRVDGPLRISPQGDLTMGTFTQEP